MAERKDPKVEKFSPEKVADWVYRCRVIDKGIPMFKTRLFGVRLPGNAVLAVCWGGRDEVGSVYFTDCPTTFIDLVEHSKSDWRTVLKMYAPEKYEEAVRAGIYIKGSRLPRIPGKR